MGGWNEGPVWLAAAVFAFGCGSGDAHLAEGQRFPAASASAPAGTAITIAHYSIETPVGYEVEDVSPRMADFYLYRVMRQSSPGVGCVLYVGNAPGFPKLRWLGQKAVKTKRDDRTAAAFQRPGAIEGLIQFYGVGYKALRDSPFQFIHYICDGLDEVGMRDMLAMVASIKIVQPHLD